MGIPLLFSTLIKNYNKPNDGICIIKKTIAKSENKINFHLDFNSILYLCLKPEIIDEDILIIHILQYLDKLILMLGNENINILHICLDGVSIDYKQIQMRNRRHHSIIYKWRSTEINTKYGNSNKELFYNTEFDTNRFSPGTTFMSKLSLQLKNHVSDLSNAIYQTINKIIVSDTLIPCEGEIKILHYIKNNPTDKTINSIIYSLDADVIIQSLISNQSLIYLLRESGNFGYLGEYYDGLNFLYLDIDELRHAFINDLCNQSPYIEKYIKTNSNNIINDLCMLFFMLGNDFIPKIHHISIHHNGIHYLTSAYLAVYEQNTINYLIDTLSLSINTKMLCDILAILSKKEDIYIQKYFTKRQNEKIPIKPDMTERERQQTLVNFMPLQYLEHESTIDPFTIGWEDRYYNMAFGFPASSNNIKNVTDFYIKSIVWNFRYYYDINCPSWTYYYPYTYAPTLKQLYNHILSIDNINTRYKFDIGEPILPQNLLVKVLPKSSSNFMIASIRNNLNNDTDDDLKPYFPNKYGLNFIFHRYYHECTPRIPHLTREIIDKIMSKYELTAEEQSRNTINDVWTKLK